MQGQEYMRGGDRVMNIKKINPLSLAKVLCVLYASFAFLFGLLGLLYFMAIGGLVQQASGTNGIAGLAAGFGVIGVIIYTALGAFFGFIGGLIAALLFNMVGGIEVTVD